MKKPEKYSGVVVTLQWHGLRAIHGWCEAKHVPQIAEFGEMKTTKTRSGISFYLKVDGRYAFDEVVLYIRSLNP